jgi:hypothetical protein
MKKQILSRGHLEAFGELCMTLDRVVGRSSLLAGGVS